MLAGALQLPATPTPAPSPLVFGSEANLVHVDAIVVDKDGRQVTDLTPSDFVIEVDKKKYTPSIARYVPLTDGDTPPLMSAATGEAPPGRVLAFLVAQPLITLERRPGRETLSNRPIRLSAIDRVNRLLRAYVENQFSQRDLAAVVNVDQPKNVAIQFRHQQSDLVKDVERLRQDTLGSPREIYIPANVPGPMAYAGEVVRIARTLIGEMQRYPGRRILVIVSSDLNPDGILNPIGIAGRDLIDAANRAGVTIYGISPAGAMSRFSEVLGAFAHDTGGSTVQGTNDIESGFQKIMELNRGYYLLGYDTGVAPSKAARKVKVEVLRGDVTVAARPLVFDRGAPIMARDRPSLFGDRGWILLMSYLSALDRYSSTGEVRPTTEAWTDSELKQLFLAVSADPFLFKVETAMLMHLAREMAARDQSDGTGSSDCRTGRDAFAFDRLAELVREKREHRSFAIRFHVAASFRYRSMHCYEHAWYWAEMGRKAFPDDATLSLTRGLADEALGSQHIQPLVALGSFVPVRPASRADSPASIAFRRERLKAAREMLERAVQKAPDSVEARLHYGRVLFRLGEHQRARVLLEETAARAEDRSLYMSSPALAGIHCATRCGRIWRRPRTWRLPPRISSRPIGCVAGSPGPWRAGRACVCCWRARVMCA